MEKMGLNRRSKVKGGQASAKSASTASEGVHNLFTRYKGVAEANPLDYVLLPHS